MNSELLHILLADDDESDRMLFTEAFLELKIKTTVRTFNDGVQLMEWLNTLDITLPHFIFLDLNMPRKNGLECLKEIKSNEKLKDILIAIYSTSDSEKDIEDTFIFGANVYITKPNNFNLLKKVLEKSLLSVHQCQDGLMKKEHFLLKV